MKPLSCLALALLVFASTLPGVRSQDEVVHLDELPVGSILETRIGMGLVLVLPQDVSRIAIADEKVAAVTVLTARQVLVHATSVGQTALFAWLEDGSIERYGLRVSRELSSLRAILADAAPGFSVEETPDGRNIVLRGNIEDAALASDVLARTRQYIDSLPEPRPALLNLLTSPNAALSGDADTRLTQALNVIDPRIRVRRIQVGDQSAHEHDSFVLEGSVRNVTDLVRAVTLAERQLGGSGTKVGAKDDTRISERRNRDFSGGGLGSRNTGTSLLAGTNPLPAGIASQVSRKLVLTSESGRVISFLEVDKIEQILVSIRVMEIDRVKARKMGIDYRVDADHLSLGMFNRPDRVNLDSIRGQPPLANLTGNANAAVAYVNSTYSILSAIDFLQQENVARAVAEPNVLTLTGEEATVLVGGEVPIPTTSANDVLAVQGYFFQSFGVRLDIRPTVDEEGVVTLEVAPSIVRPEQDLSVEGVPGFEVQSVQTVARVMTGESLIVGGLLNYEEAEEENKLPLLGDIPLLSGLFRWSRHVRREQELLFVITPQVLANAVGGVQRTMRLPTLDEADERGLLHRMVPGRVAPDGYPSEWEKWDAAREDDDAPDAPRSYRPMRPGTAPAVRESSSAAPPERAAPAKPAPAAAALADALPAKTRPPLKAPIQEQQPKQPAEPAMADAPRPANRDAAPVSEASPENEIREREVESLFDIVGQIMDDGKDRARNADDASAHRLPEPSGSGRLPAQAEIGTETNDEKPGTLYDLVREIIGKPKV